MNFGAIKTRVPAIASSHFLSPGQNWRDHQVTTRWSKGGSDLMTTVTTFKTFMSPSTRWILHLTNATSSADRTPCPDVDMIFFMNQIFSFSNHFQFLCFWTYSLHYFSTYYTMEYNDWKKHRSFGFNGVYLVNLGCADIAMVFYIFQSFSFSNNFQVLGF